MNLKLHWHKSISLGKFPYGRELDLRKIPKKAGLYIFLRKYGDGAEALYVGKAKVLQARINQQLNNLRLMHGIQGARNGERRLVYAEFEPKPGQNKDAALPICEKALIRYYLAQGHNLLNIQGTQLKYHEIDSTREDLRKLLPVSTKMLVK